MSLLIAAVMWNLGTWYLGLPASSSHTLIGSILGVGIAHSLMQGQGPFHGVNVGKIGDIGLALLVSPLIGFMFTAFMVWFLKKKVPNPVLFSTPSRYSKPPGWIRAMLIFTCSGVSFAHGSNDGQKGMGLVMLILVGLSPAYFALNLEKPNQGKITREAALQLHLTLQRTFVDRGEVQRAQLSPEQGFTQPVALTVNPLESKLLHAQDLLEDIAAELSDKQSLAEIPAQDRWSVREKLFEANQIFHETRGLIASSLTPDERRDFQASRSRLKSSIEYVPQWVILTIALCLGLGTMVGWKRVVVTVGEKIGKSHLTYSQGASAELVAMTTIGVADSLGFPVSTTHVLSSGIAGSMWATQSGVNRSTVRSILLAWIFTLPAAICLSGTLFYLACLYLR
jgi:PiT family inorganic phosphate transporter